MFRLNTQRSRRANTAAVIRGSLVLTVFVNILTVEPAAALSCICDLDYCDPLDSKQCDYGLVKDVCNCCDVCAKGPGESCGGHFAVEGFCADGYDCMVQVPFGSTWTKYFHTPGFCQASELFTTYSAAVAVALLLILPATMCVLP